jgi:hypothetical protein
VLSSFIIDELKKDSNSVVAYFYCNYDDPNRQEPDFILAMLLKQLVSVLPTLPQALIELYEAHKAEGFASARPDADELEKLILKTFNEIEKDCIIVIDALDEIPQPARKRLYTFFTQLKDLEGYSTVSLFITSRWLADIKTHMTKASPFIIDIKEEDTSADIVQYIVSEVDKAVEDEELLEGEISEELIEDIKDHLQKQAGGMWVAIIPSCLLTNDCLGSYGCDIRLLTYASKRRSMTFKKPLLICLLACTTPIPASFTRFALSQHPEDVSPNVHCGGCYRLSDHSPLLKSLKQRQSRLGIKSLSLEKPQTVLPPS